MFACYIAFTVYAESGSVFVMLCANFVNDSATPEEGATRCGCYKANNIR